MNLRIGKIRRYNNKILIASPSFKIGTNVKINLDERRHKPDVKPKSELEIKSNKEHKQDVKLDLNAENDKSDIKSNRERKQDVEMIETNLIRIRSPMRKKRLL